MADTTTQCNYGQRLALSDKEKDQNKLQFKVDTGKLNLAGVTLSTRQSLSQARERLDDLKSASTLNFQAIIDAQAEVQQGEDVLKALALLDAELFQPTQG